MNILVTGARGFVGKNLVSRLKNIKLGNEKNEFLSSDLEIMEYDIDTKPELLDEFCSKADFVFNLAGVNRPKNDDEFLKGNFGFASTLLDTLKKYNNTCPVMISSSIQAALDNPYGKSKRAGEELMRSYSEETGAKVLIYRFPNVFGKWCRPNYNSAIATFCYNIANGLPIKVNDPSVVMHLVYIDDVVDELIRAAAGKENRVGEFCEVPVVLTATLGKISDTIQSFGNMQNDLSVPNVGDLLTKYLHATYLSYLPKDKFSYPLNMNIDERGSFTEILRTASHGQFSVNISKPGIVKGNHWHHTKNEKFLVVKGKGVIRFRNMMEPNSEVIEYFVSDEKLEVVDIPTGYTHNIENLGDDDMVTFMWCNECFNKDKPDTYFEKV